MRMKIFVLISLALSIFGCRFQGEKTDIQSRKPCVEIRLEYGKNLDNKPIEIILERKEKKYSKKISNGQLNYYFYNLKSGKYLIILAFLEKGKKPYYATYGYETVFQESMDFDSTGRGYSTLEVVKNNEIKVYRNRHTIVDLHIDFEKNTHSTKPPATQFDSIIFRFGDFYKIEMKSYYYKLHFIRSFGTNDIDKKTLEENEKIRQKFIKKKEDI
jgi:hypothetical protein